MKKRGLAKAMAKEIFRIALSRKLEMIQALMMADQHVAIKVFSELGFKEAANLKGFAKDLSGTKHDLVVMVNDTEELWRRLSDYMMDLDFKRMG